MFTNKKGGAKMNKAQLVEAVSGSVCTKKEAIAAVETVLETIKKALKKKEAVTISGFGTFNIKRTKARMGRNPRNGEAIKISARNKVSFKASKDLKTLLQ